MMIGGLTLWQCVAEGRTFNNKMIALMPMLFVRFDVWYVDSNGVMILNSELQCLNAT